MNELRVLQRKRGRFLGKCRKTQDNTCLTLQEFLDFLLITQIGDTEITSWWDAPRDKQLKCKVLFLSSLIENPQFPISVTINLTEKEPTR